jgi:aspartyl/asparaginyl beta-hydroxylase (cupin superfamily)
LNQTARELKSHRRGYAIVKRKTLGLTVPPSQFARADEVIE